jgi:hypothetical protein
MLLQNNIKAKNKKLYGKKVILLLKRKIIL